MKYTFVVESTISLHIDVEAKSLHAAIRKAQKASVVGLCWQCAQAPEGEWSTSGEIDCDPSTSPLVDAYCDGEEILQDACEEWEGRL